MISRENLIYLIQEVCKPNETDGIHSERGRKFGRDYSEEYKALLEYTSFVTKNSFNERYRILKYGWTEYPKCANPECDERITILRDKVCHNHACKVKVKNLTFSNTQKEVEEKIKNSKGSIISIENLLLLIEKQCAPNSSLKIHNSKSFNFQMNFPDETKNLILLTLFVKEKKGISFNERYRVLKLGWKDYPICKAECCNNKIKSSLKEYCGCNIGRLIQVKETSLEKYGVDSYFKTDEGRKMISEKVKIAYKTKDVMKKRKITNLEKYGTEHHMQNKEQMEKIKSSLISKYGGVGSNSEIIKLKVENTNLEKYGFKSALSNEEVKKKKNDTNLERYGVETVFLNEEIKEKMNKTMIDKYGVENIFSHKTYTKEKMHDKYGVSNPSQLEWVKTKKEETSLKNYGTRFPMQNSEHADKVSKNSYLLKEYIWKSGEISLVQGFEDQCLKELEEQGYLFSDIKTDKKDMPIIWYEDEYNIKRRYFPDIYIEKDNLIIEVKSDWTMLKNFNLNLRKGSIVKSMGFKYKLKVYDKR